MQTIKSFNIKHPVLLLKVLNNGILAVLDSQISLRLIDTKNYKIMGGFKTGMLHERYIGTHIDIAPGGGVCASIVPNTNQAALFSVAKKELLYKVSRHQGEIESLCIDPNGRYFVTGGQDGKTFVWSLKTARLAFTLPPHSDYVTTVAFNDNGQWLATGSFDKTITVLNIATMKKPLKLRAHSAAIMKLLFLPSFRLLSVDKEGGLIVWDIRNGKNLKRMTKVNDTVTDIAVSHDFRFLFVGTKLGYIALYDLETYELLTQRYLKSKETITALGFIEDGFHLAVGTQDGNVDIYPLFGDQERYLQMIKAQEYKAYYEEVEENPVLMYSDSYRAAERLWEATLAKAKILLAKSQKDTAIKMLEPFKVVPKKSKFITQILRDFDQYTVFQKYIEEGRYPLAYSMAKQYTSFQESAAYLKMEKRWKLSFMKAQELILSKNGEEQARQLLSPFRGISEKSLLIGQLFAEQKMYLYFKKLIAQKEFVKMFELVKNHGFLKEFKEYQIVLDYADKLYIKSQEAYSEADYVSAQKLAGMLKEFPDFTEEAQEMEDSIRAKQLFYDAIHAGNLVNAFAYMGSYPLLYETKEGEELELQWSKLVDSALKFAAKGDAMAIKQSIEIYLDISAKYEAIANLFQQCYNNQLEQALRVKMDTDTIETGIKNYLSMFGDDDFILYYIDRYNSAHQKTFSHENESIGELTNWTPNLVIPSILKSRT
ncbi:MAG: WD40 repeat domain-containing protein [Campylobacterota bacterium]|nr:WD40 repeat domain-containing protein [Campylobacterota bacterium]